MKKTHWRNLPAALLALLAAGCAGGRSTADIPAVRDFDAQRYLGTWYEIARLPHSFERGLDRVSAEYTLRDDGGIDVENSGWRDGERRSARGVAYLKGAPEVGELRVSFFRPFYGDYRIIELAPDYSSAIVTGATRDYLWILARTPTLDEAVRARYLARIAGWEYETDKLEWPDPCEPSK